MADRQRFIIGNLAQYGMVEEVDALDLPPNAFQLLKNFAFYKGRLGAAGRWGAMSSATPIFNGTNYACCGLWELYNSGILKLKAGTFAEYENAAATMYEIPCWLGTYATVTQASGECAGMSLDGAWSTTTFPRACNKWLTKNDKVFLSSLATPEFAKNFTDLGGAVGGSHLHDVDATWSGASDVILQSDSHATYADCAYNATTTEGLAFNTGAVAAVTNQFFTIRRIRLLDEGANASLMVVDNTTKRGYALQVEQTATPGNCYTFTVIGPNGYIPPVTGDVYTRPNGTEFTVIGYRIVAGATLLIYTEGTGDPALSPIYYNTIVRKTGYSGGSPFYQVTSSVVTTGPMTVTLRLWDGYFASTDSAVGDNAAVVWEKTGITDWGYSTYNNVYHEDLWMWWRDNFITFGYGPTAQGCVTKTSTPAAPRVGFALKNSYIRARTGSYNCIYSFDVATNKTGPYAISSFTDGTKVNITGAPANGNYLIWASKYANRKKIIPASDYVLFVTDNTSNANFPVTIWRGGMMEEVPLTNPTYSANYGYAANDAAVYKGRVFLAGSHKMIHKYGANVCYEWNVGLNEPTKVKWSSPYHPDVWEDCYPSGTTADEYYGAGNIDFAETNGAVNAIGQLRDVLVVYKSDAIAMLSPTGIALDPFSVDYMAWNVGVNEPRAVGISPEVHLFPAPDCLWQVQIGEVTKTPSRYSVGQYGKVWMLPGENTVFMQAYYFGDTQNLCLAYNYQNNSVYYAELKSIVDLVEQKDAVYGITLAGLYLYQTRETNSIPDTYIVSSGGAGTGSTRAITSVISMGDLLNNKTIYNVDVFTRARNTGAAPETASIDITVTCDNTAESDYTTVTGQIVGKEQPGFAIVANPINETNLWRFRYNKILTGLTFQVNLRLNASYLTHEIVRIEIDYEPHGLSKQA